MHPRFAASLAVMFGAGVVAIVSLAPAAVSDMPPAVTATSSTTATAPPADPLADDRADLARALVEARQLGYQPCEPRLYEVDPVAQPNVAGEAGWPEWFSECLVGVLPNLEPADYRLEVIRHEVCHLATGPEIGDEVDAGNVWAADADAFHQAPQFQTCVRRMGG